MAHAYMGKINIIFCATMATLTSGCAVVSVASSGASIAATAIGVGVSAGTTVVGAVAAVGKGAVSLASPAD